MIFTVSSKQTYASRFNISDGNFEFKTKTLIFFKGLFFLLGSCDADHLSIKYQEDKRERGDYTPLKDTPPTNGSLEIHKEGDWKFTGTLALAIPVTYEHTEEGEKITPDNNRKSIPVLFNNAFSIKVNMSKDAIAFLDGIIVIANEDASFTISDGDHSELEKLITNGTLKKAAMDDKQNELIISEESREWEMTAEYLDYELDTAPFKNLNYNEGYEYLTSEAEFTINSWDAIKNSFPEKPTLILIKLKNISETAKELELPEVNEIYVRADNGNYSAKFFLMKFPMIALTDKLGGKITTTLLPDKEVKLLYVFESFKKNEITAEIGISSIGSVEIYDTNSVELLKK